MPALKKKTPTPKAPLGKRLVHTFYLVQPVLQFVALLSLLLVLSHCSPLNPSSEKTLPKPPMAGAGGSGSGSGNEEFLKEDMIVSSLHELPSEPLSVVSEDGFQAAAESSFQADQPVRETEVKSRLDRRNRIQVIGGAKKIHKPLLAIALSADQQQALWRDGSTRVALTDYLQAAFELNARKLLFRELKDKRDELNAKAFLVVSDDAAPLNGADPHELVMKLKVSLGVLSDEKAYLEVRRTDDEAKTALLLSAAKGIRKLAVVLE
ncbi:MAG: hypothetical protein ACXVBE_10680 [Bdellovibrionota bacterium]